MRKSLSKEDMIKVIEGKGSAQRIPMSIHSWIRAERFGEQAPKFRNLLSEYPNDIEKITLKLPKACEYPEDDKNYCWVKKDMGDMSKKAIDSIIAIDNWDELDDIIANFPDPNYVHLIPQNIKSSKEQYSICDWAYWMFERLWSLRGMENALCDFYEYPEKVHQLFRALTDFYKVVVERAKRELGVDAVMITDDIGTQTSQFFSHDIFKEFFKPYYKDLVDHVHSLGMHFWMHSCGNIFPLIEDLIDIGVDVIHPIQKYTMDEVQVVEKYGGRICFWAGFDVQQTIPYGTAEDVRKEVRFLIDTYYRNDGRLILTAGNGMTPDTPYDSLEALLDEIYNYGTQKVNQEKY